MVSLSLSLLNQRRKRDMHGVQRERRSCRRRSCSSRRRESHHASLPLELRGAAVVEVFVVAIIVVGGIEVRKEREDAREERELTLPFIVAIELAVEGCHRRCLGRGGQSRRRWSSPELFRGSYCFFWFYSSCAAMPGR
ncbi:uncharacterized protein LOC110270308 [Arachis ipaensis]|uniref:uncharacterized protein LOC110270308 n=1 Tax=Arachis ipaensis TaxID=130454 RepID=UPI000A2AF427|nr:uncharacterized protein LOC110270308 [Arachis ipaensis]